MFLWHYVNYQQDNWTDWLTTPEFQYNNKKHVATGRTPFELNFRRHPWKEDLVIAQGCGQTLGLGLVDRNRTVVYY